MDNRNQSFGYYRERGGGTNVCLLINTVDKINTPSDGRIQREKVKRRTGFVSARRVIRGRVPSPFEIMMAFTINAETM